MKIPAFKNTGNLFASNRGDDQTLQVNCFHDIDDGPESHAEIDLTKRPHIKRLQVNTFVHSSASSVDTATATASLLRRQSFQAVDQMLIKLGDRTSSHSIINRLAVLKEEIDFGIAKLTKTRELERLEGNSAEILRCIRDALTLASTEEFCRQTVLGNICKTLQELRVKTVVGAEDVKAFRSSLRQMKLRYNKLLVALKLEVNKYDYAGVQIDEPNSDEVHH